MSLGTRIKKKLLYIMIVTIVNLIFGEKGFGLALNQSIKNQTIEVKL